MVIFLFPSFHVQLLRLLELHPSRAVEVSVWLKAVLLNHTAYLTTVSWVLPLKFSRDFISRNHERLALQTFRNFNFSTMWLQSGWNIGAINVTYTQILHHRQGDVSSVQVPHLLNSVSGLYQLLDTRVSMFGKLCRLQGKLDLVLAQAEQLEACHMEISQPLVSVNVGG